MRVSLLQIGLHQTSDCLLHMHLNEPKLFIALVSHYFSKESDVVVRAREAPDSINYGTCPLNNEVLKSISLVQVCVHELFHCFSREMGFLAFSVILNLLGVYVHNHLFELFESESSS